MMTRLRVFAALFVALALFATACGGDDGAGQEEGEVVSIGTSVPLDALTSGNVAEGELTVTSLNVDIGDEVVDVTVASEDQAQLSDLFSQGDLSEGDRVVVEQTDGDEWVFVEVAGGN